ncbi:MAG: DNA repair protein RecO (recombination protein O) [Hyphomonadaceae bacterium]|nr:MAG: DNA repair protein RecO (recombination protein O) [Hyphomonadaceae bacterium]
MQAWESDAITLFARKHSENDAILEVFSKSHGRISAYVFGGTGSKKRAFLEPGQIINVAWETKSPNYMGTFTRLETVVPISTIMHDAAALCAIKCACELMHEVLPAEMAIEPLYDATQILIESLTHDANWPAIYVRWEAGLLTHTGFGLDLTECALTGVKDDLAWVSPKTGRAACKAAGEPFKDKLLALPQFLIDANTVIEKGDIADGLALTGWFLERDVLGQGHLNMPETRARLIYALGRADKL